MLKKVIYDYLGYLNWKNIKKVHSNFSAWWIYIYMLTCFPILLDLNEHGGLATYYVVIIPILFGIMTLTVVPMQLPKQMFLCPMEDKERKKYVHELFAVRLLVPFILGLAGSGIAISLKKSHPVIIGLNILALVSMLLCGSITSWEGSVWSREENGAVKRVKDEKLKGLYTINILGIAGSLIVLLANILMVDDTLTIGFGIFLGVSSMILIILDILVVRYYPVIVENTTDYEKTMRLEANKTKH